MYDIRNLKNLNASDPNELEIIKRILYFNEARPKEREALYKAIINQNN